MKSASTARAAVLFGCLGWRSTVIAAVTARNFLDFTLMGSGGAEGRRETTLDTNLSDKELAAEDARRQSKNARAATLISKISLDFTAKDGSHMPAGRASRTPVMLQTTPRELSPIGTSDGHF
jgi:hypothetical protein